MAADDYAVRTAGSFGAYLGSRLDGDRWRRPELFLCSERRLGVSENGTLVEQGQPLERCCHGSGRRRARSCLPSLSPCCWRRKAQGHSLAAVENPTERDNGNRNREVSGPLEVKCYIDVLSETQSVA